MKLLPSFGRPQAAPTSSPNIAVNVAIWTIHDGVLKTLLVEKQDGRLGIPGAMLEVGEKLADCVSRILPEAANSQHIFTEQVATVSAPANDPRGSLVTISYVALTPYSEVILDADFADGKAQFVTATELPNLAYDHNTILLLTLRRLKYNLEYTNLVHTLLPTEFSFTQLQTVYETILGRELDRRNFRKKFMLLELIEETGAMSSGGAHRPAKLYRFIDRGTIELRHWL